MPAEPNAEYAQFLLVLGALGKLATFALILERGLSVIYEHEWFLYFFEKKETQTSRLPGLKATLAAGAAIGICHLYKFDVLAAVFAPSPASGFGMTATGLIAAGGSAGAIALLQGYLGISKTVRDAKIEARQAEAAAEKDRAKASAAVAKAAAVAAGV